MWQYIKNIYHLCVACLAVILYGFPSKKLTVIGITGTDGKTTTSSIVYHILYTAGYNVSMITTVSAIIDGKEYDTGFHVTTPSSFSVQRFFKKASVTPLKKEKRFMILEVTSHALDQHRVFGIDFDVSAITNVTHEHLDYHKTYEKYVAAKAKLLQKTKKAIIVNKDDQSYALLNKFVPKTFERKWTTYGMKVDSDINPKVFPFKTKLVGRFNMYNCLAAIGVCRSLGVSDSDIKKALLSVKAPKGREEIVHEGEFTIMVDFAHTPNAIHHVLQTVKGDIHGKVIHVFGSAGQRDVKKRPHMGAASARYGDISVITAEDPRSESVDKICKEIVKGIKNAKQKEKNNTLFVIPDRQSAINKAILLAKKGDIVIITGKGHEQSMNFGRKDEHWSDYEAVERALVIRNK